MGNNNKTMSEMENEIQKLNSEIKEKDIIIKKTKEYLFILEYELEKKNKELETLQKDLK